MANKIKTICSNRTDVYIPGDELYGKDMRCPVCHKFVRYGLIHYGERAKIRVRFQQEDQNSHPNQRDESGWVEEHHMNDIDLQNLKLRNLIKANNPRLQKPEFTNGYEDAYIVQKNGVPIWGTVLRDGEDYYAIVGTHFYIVEYVDMKWRIK